jgi:hypothetical protein
MLANLWQETHGKIFSSRLNFWAEDNGILSPNQYDFRKGTGMRDCLALLTNEISCVV